MTDTLSEPFTHVSADELEQVDGGILPILAWAALCFMLCTSAYAIGYGIEEAL